MTDEERLRREVEKALKDVRTRLGRAQRDIDAARGVLAGGVGIYWDNTGVKLRKRKESASHLRELLAALEVADKALSRAGRSCDAIGDSVPA